jgi:hypothetical protein
MKRFLLAGLLLAQPLPAYATDAPLTGLMHVTEIAPSGAAFQFWAPSDVVGLHSRLKVEVALTTAELSRRVYALEAAVPADDGEVEATAGRLDELVNTLILALAEAPAGPGRAALMLDNPTYVQHAIGKLRQALARRAAKETPYKVVVRARLQHSTQGGLFPSLRKPDEVVRELTPEDAPPAALVRRKPGPLPAGTAALLARDLGLGGKAPWVDGLARLDALIARQPQRQRELERLRATARGVIDQLQALGPLLEANAATSKDLRLGYIPEQAELDLDTLPTRRAGDHVELQLVLQRDDEDVAVLEERTAVLHKVGLYPDAKVGATFTDLGTWSPSLTLVAKWGYRTGFTASNTEMFGPQMRLRGMMSGGALMWNEVWDPGIALNLSGQGVGVGLSFFKELLQVGRGYNPMTGSFYWYGGLGIPVSLFDVVQQ